MKFKRKLPRAKIFGRCSICAGQRRHFGWGNQKMRATLKAMKKDQL